MEYYSAMAGAHHIYNERASSASLKPSTGGYPTPPSSASPTKSSFFLITPSSPSSSQLCNKYANDSDECSRSRRRCTSLYAKFPGDMSHRPLDQLRKEAKAANRSSHLKKRNTPGADTIDLLDRSGFGYSYHHEGPYDACLLARNRSRRHAPIEALKTSNEEALRATPKEFIKASIERHVPLEGTAIIPPGRLGMDGHIMQYEEGADLMREADAPGGAYKRWQHMKYLPDDLKGKGEPSYSIEKALKKDKVRRKASGSVMGYELLPVSSTADHRQPNSDGLISNKFVPGPARSSSVYLERNGSRRRGLSTGQRMGEGIKRRLQSLARGTKNTGTRR